MFLVTENKNMFGLGVGISTGFEIQQISHFWGVGLTPMAISNVLHILPVTQGTRIYMWYRGGDLYSLWVGISTVFEIFNFLFLRGIGLTRGHF